MEEENIVPQQHFYLAFIIKKRLLEKSKIFNKQLLLDIVNKHGFQAKYAEQEDDKQMYMFLKPAQFDVFLKEAGKLNFKKEAIKQHHQKVHLEGIKLMHMVKDSIEHKKLQKLVNFREVGKTVDKRIQMMEKYQEFYYDTRLDFIDADENNLTSEEINEMIFKNVFNSAEQIVIMNQVLDNIVYEIDSKQISLKQYMIDHKIISRVLPLHDTQALDSVETTQEIRQYFGEEVSFYFEFVKFFSKWLILPSLVGIGVQLLDNFDLHDNTEDSPFESLYSIFIIIWANVFYCQWKRHEYSLRFQYRSHGSHFQQLQTLKHYDRKELETKQDEVTGEHYQHFPFKRRVYRYIISFLATIPLIILTVAFLIISLNVRGLIDEQHDLLKIPFFVRMGEKGGIFGPGSFLSFAPTILHIFILAKINQIYQKLATTMTEKECHSTMYQQKDSFIQKRFIFEFFTYFTDLFYVGFINFNIMALKQQLISLYTFDEMRRLGVETFVPFLSQRKFLQFQKMLLKKSKYFKYFPGISRLKKALEGKIKKKEGKLQDEKNFIEEKIVEINKSDIDLFDDYVEIIMNFGYLVLFASAFPLAPVLILLFNLLESASDQFKLQNLYRRPIPRKAKGIHTWNHILNTLSIMCVFTNIILFAFSSDQIVNFFPSLFSQDLHDKGLFTHLLQSVSDSMQESSKHIADLLVGSVIQSDVAEAEEQPMVGATPAQGKARYVVAVVFAIEHFLFGLIWFIRKWMNSRKHWTETYTKRKEYLKTLQ